MTATDFSNPKCLFCGLVTTGEDDNKIQFIRLPKVCGNGNLPWIKRGLVDAYVFICLNCFTISHVGPMGQWKGVV